MPSKNTLKQYVENSFYHIYNRGVNKRKIFVNHQDYLAFLAYLKSYLSPPPDRKTQKIPFTLKGLSFKGVPYQHKNYFGNIELIAYCLMPNHFHLLIKQTNPSAINFFMRSLTTRFTMRFNKIHNRIGPLFQGVYKAVLIDQESYLLHLTNYIHRNPTSIWSKSLREYPYSSYAEYLGIRHSSWINPKPILDFFRSPQNQSTRDCLSYESFVEGNTNSTFFIENLTLE